MSGIIVGEVIATAASLKQAGITDRGFHALIAIAEKCHTDTRRASVPWSWIQAGLYGASKRTAERAVVELKDSGYLRVVRIGFTNQHTARAPIYEISPLDTDTVLSSSSQPDTDTAVSSSSGVDTDKPKLDTDKSDGGYRHSSVVLNGSSFNGSSSNGGNARGTRIPDDWQPPPELVAQMRDHHPQVDVDSEIEQFRDYWTSEAGTRANKRDWNAAFRVWIRREAKHRATRSDPNAPSAYEAKKAHNHAVFQELGDDHQTTTTLRELTR